MKRKTCADNRSNGPNISKMLRFTPGKNADVNDIDAIVTPPGYYKENSWLSTETPPTVSSTDNDGSFAEVGCKPLGRFLSFDAKRSLFSGKRLAEQADDSPATKRLRETESGIGCISLEPFSPISENVDVKSVVHRLSTDDAVIADGSRSCTLPTIAGKHSDLKAISPETMNDVLQGCYDDELDHVTVIDCRYPYEFDGGHIKGAVNLFTRSAIQEFLSRHSCSHASPKKHVIIFHCEFSSERGPKMYRHLRSEDRAMNKDQYPRLNFPEIYLLEGGYKAFFYKFMEQCFPQTYKPMLHKDHAADLRHFRGKSKSWTAGERPLLTRTTLRF
ncbi:M-phase inducer phosphatase 3-like [Mercenaria mercenaria]|uniref:M-phase inducer phosphatase 3-like n=1 Tax=Mercenaria mercenaria TaxID=6596 RepID=UPI00234F6A9F|nr:M-phase inducer phosphatase 3-like [Mercenaria mercenaria]